MRKKKVFVALGDSITYGYPFSPEYSWVERIRTETGWQVINSGVPGDTLGDMLLRLEASVLSYNPDLVSIMGGTNDIFVGMTQPQIQQNFESIMDKLLARNLKVIVGLPLPVDDPIEGVLRFWRAWLQNYCRSQKLVLIDFYQDFVDHEGRIREELLLDGCHPGLEGYAVMGERALQTMGATGLLYAEE